MHNQLIKLLEDDDQIEAYLNGLKLQFKSVLDLQQFDILNDLVQAVKHLEDCHLKSDTPEVSVFQ